MISYKPTWHFLQRCQEAPQNHRFFADDAALIHKPEYFLDYNETGEELYYGPINGEDVLGEKVPEGRMTVPA
jgi:hypothetical protein